ASERAIGAVAPRRTLAIVGLPAADPNNVGLGRRDTELADRRCTLIIENRLEGRSRVCSLPHPPRRRSNIEGGTVAFNHGEVINASAHDGRTDCAPLQILQRRFFRSQLAVLSIHGRRENNSRYES